MHWSRAHTPPTYFLQKYMASSDRRVRMTLIDPNFNYTPDEIAQIPLPARTKSYVPVGHRELRDEVVSRFANAGRYVDNEGYHMR